MGARIGVGRPLGRLAVQMLAAVAVLFAAWVFPRPAMASTSSPPPLDRGTPCGLQDKYFILAPEGWSCLANPAPRAEFALASYPIRKGGDCGPTEAMAALPPDGALLWVSEVYSPRHRGPIPQRPARFSFDDLAPALDVCSRETGASVIRFRKGDSFFNAHIVFGPDASADTRSALLASLSSLEINRCPFSPSRWSFLNVDHGATGDTVTAFGPTLRGEDGFYFPATAIELWWNERVDHTDEETVRPVDGVVPFLVASQEEGEVRGTCEYELKFQVPDVPPGLYPIAVRVYHEGGYGHIGRWTFEVTQRERAAIASPPVQPQATRGPLPWNLAAVAGAGGAILTLLAVSVVAAVRKRRDAGP